MILVAIPNGQGMLKKTAPRCWKHPGPRPNLDWRFDMIDDSAATSSVKLCVRAGAGGAK